MHPSFQLSQLSTTPAEVELHLGLEQDASNPADSISIVSALIRGPFCEYASTLPATISFRRSLKETDYFKVTVPDPCYWTPTMPHVYRVEVQYRCGDDPSVETARFERSLRRCEIRNNALFIDGARTIIRGVGWDNFESEPDWIELRATRTSVVVTELNVDFLTKCSKHGVPVFMTGNNVQRTEKLSIIEDYPAFFGFIAARHENDKDRTEGNQYQARVTLAAFSNSSNPRSNQLTFAVSDAKNGQPIDWTEKRKTCDTLQGEVSAIGEFAGYVLL